MRVGVLRVARGALCSVVAVSGGVVAMGPGDASATAQPAAGGASAAASTAIGVHAVDMAVPAGISETTLTWQGSANDYDRDGCADLLVNRHTLVPELYHNNCNGTFTLVANVFPKSDHHSQAWGDFNGDGLTDMYWAVGGGGGQGVSTKELWIQQPNHTFVNESAQFGMNDSFGRGRGTTALDLNNDGHLDLYTGNDSPRWDQIADPNRLWVNNGNGTFRDASAMGLDYEEDVHLADTVDVNHDGFPDIFLQGQYQSAIYRNNGGTGFTDVARGDAVADRPQRRRQARRPRWRRAP